MRTSLIAAALAGAATLASAPAVAETFNGPYVGITTGWDRTETNRSPANGQALDAGTSRDGLLLGFYGGYNRKVGEHVVLGAEAGFSGTIDDSSRATIGGAAVRIDPRYSFDLTARAGYLVTDKALLYVRGGYANQRVRTEVQTANGLVRSSDSLDGWLVGGGVKYAITERISARAEYRYSDVGENGGRYDRHQTLIGVSYNF